MDTKDQNGKQLIGARLAYYREKAGLSVVDLEKATQRPGRPDGIRRSYIYKIQEGKANPTLELIEELLKPCKVTLAEFLTGLRTGRSEQPDLYDMLDVIVQGRIPRQIEGIRVNLEAISLNVKRLLHEQPELRNQSPPGPVSREGAERKERANIGSPSKKNHA